MYPFKAIIAQGSEGRASQRLVTRDPPAKPVVILHHKIVPPMGRVEVVEVDIHTERMGLEPTYPFGRISLPTRLLAIRLRSRYGEPGSRTLNPFTGDRFQDDLLAICLFSRCPGARRTV